MLGLELRDPRFLAEPARNFFLGSALEKEADSFAKVGQGLLGRTTLAGDVQFGIQCDILTLFPPQNRGKFGFHEVILVQQVDISSKLPPLVSAESDPAEVQMRGRTSEVSGQEP